MSYLYGQRPIVEDKFDNVLFQNYADGWLGLYDPTLRYILRRCQAGSPRRASMLFLDERRGHLYDWDEEAAILTVQSVIREIP